jgi:hypothetical protein
MQQQQGGMPFLPSYAGIPGLPGLGVPPGYGMPFGYGPGGFGGGGFGRGGGGGGRHQHVVPSTTTATCDDGSTPTAAGLCADGSQPVADNTAASTTPDPGTASTSSVSSDLTGGTIATPAAAPVGVPAASPAATPTATPSAPGSWQSRQGGGQRQRGTGFSGGGPGGQMTSVTATQPGLQPQNTTAEAPPIITTQQQIPGTTITVPVKTTASPIQPVQAPTQTAAPTIVPQTMAASPQIPIAPTTSPTAVTPQSTPSRHGGTRYSQQHQQQQMWQPQQQHQQTRGRYSVALLTRAEDLYPSSELDAALERKGLMKRPACHCPSYFYQGDKEPPFLLSDQFPFVHGYNFHPGEDVYIRIRLVLYGNPEIEENPLVLEDHRMAQCDEHGSFVTLFQVDIGEMENAAGLIECLGNSSKKFGRQRVEL